MLEHLATIADFVDFIMKVVNVMLSPRIVWEFLIAMSYWIVAVSCSVLIIYHAVTQDPNMGRMIGVIIVTYILAKGANLLL